MNYIYDIYLNFNKTYYDFYEWNNNDKVMHIKKIPLFKVSTSNLKKMILKIKQIFIIVKKNYLL